MEIRRFPFSSDEGWSLRRTPRDGGQATANRGTLAGQGLYRTSKSLIKEIDFNNVTRNSSTYAQNYTALKYLGYIGLGINLSIDGYDYMHQKASGIETIYNMSVDFGSYYMGPLGLIYSPAMKQYPKTLTSHPEFMYPGSDDYMH